MTRRRVASLYQTLFIGEGDCVTETRLSSIQVFGGLIRVSLRYACNTRLDDWVCEGGSAASGRCQSMYQDVTNAGVTRFGYAVMVHRLAASNHIRRVNHNRLLDKWIQNGE